MDENQLAHGEPPEDPDDEDPPVLRGENAAVLERPTSRRIRPARPEWSAEHAVVRYPRQRGPAPAEDRTEDAELSTTFDINDLLIANRRPLLHKLFWFCHGDRELAEDLVQETCIVAYRYRDQLAQHPNPAAWLYTVATRAAIDYFHREHLGRRKHSEAAELAPPSPGRTGAFEELVDALSDARERQVITLLFLFGYPRISVAEALGISVRTVTSVKASALQKLKSLLTTEGDKS
ncbi:RNA polymerase sigma factor [Nocardia sp. NPDC127526]|uniref:RNA polymerase sigma factor n=1 Tax=Nocardia sp. NPDC127526 TaxID=3345393 RepID=UPI003628EA84